MTMISDKRVEQAITILVDTQHEAAKARAAAEHMDDLTKTVLAKLIAESDGKTVAERENYARSHPTYLTHLDQLKLIRETDYTWRDRRSAAAAIIEMWRTEQSNQRARERVR